VLLSSPSLSLTSTADEELFFSLIISLYSVIPDGEEILQNTLLLSEAPEYPWS
jgi:hypothetical protein